MLDAQLAVELEIFRHLLASIAEEMGERLRRAAYSPNIKERRDYSCALFGAQAEMIAQAAHIPVHLGSMPMSVRCAMAHLDSLGRPWRRDDRVILNDPYAGGTHLPDITLVAPCFVTDEPQPRFFVACRAHHADVGGISAGSLPLGTHIDQEGLRIPPTLWSEEVMARLQAATRTPAERRGDMRAQLACLDLGVQRLEALCHRYSATKVSQRADQLQDHAERLTRALLRDIPDGTYHHTELLDDDGQGTLDVTLRCTLTIEGDTLTADLRACDDQVAGPLNAVRAIAASAVSYVLRCLAPDGLPAGGGCMRPVTLLTRPGSIADATYPSPVAAGNVETSQRLVDLILGAFAQALPERTPAASCGSMNNVTIGGHDARHDRPFAYYETLAGGAGASPLGPGADAVHTHMTNTLNTPIEALEHAYPFRVEAYRIRDTPAGPSRHPGGHGVERVYTFDAPAEVTLITERRRHAPPGAQGGAPGVKGQNLLNGEALPGKVSLQVQAGDRVTIRTPGGGGWGEP